MFVTCTCPSTTNQPTSLSPPQPPSSQLYKGALNAFAQHLVSGGTRILSQLFARLQISYAGEGEKQTGRGVRRRNKRRRKHNMNVTFDFNWWSGRWLRFSFDRSAAAARSPLRMGFWEVGKRCKSNNMHIIPSTKLISVSSPPAGCWEWTSVVELFSLRPWTNGDGASSDRGRRESEPWRMERDFSGSQVAVVCV